MVMTGKSPYGTLDVFQHMWFSSLKKSSDAIPPFDYK
jgi:hypothetical protein